VNALLHRLNVRWTHVLLCGFVVALAAMVSVIFYAFRVEPEWVVVRTIRLSPSPRLRVLHITDVHHKGDRDYLESVVRRLNAIPADMVCFTGDLVEDVAWLDDALDILSKLDKPLYGVGGNHDYWELDVRRELRKAFAATGGAWLRDERVLGAAGRVEIVGSTGRRSSFPRLLAEGAERKLLLVHDPVATDTLPRDEYGVILSGHTHGGQVWVPGFGALVRPPPVGAYDRGLFDTTCGPLYVNPGIGTYHLKVRLFCRPEITVIEL
jgi:uncharacterized protein